jgi:hypothetical protein
VEIDGVLGKGDETVRIQPSRCACYGGQVGGVLEAVHDVKETDGYGPYIENFAVNWIETNYTVNFAENYFESAVR